MRKDRSQKQYIFVCNGKDCLKNGAKTLRKELEREIRSRKLKKNYQIVDTRCMDHCKEGPSLVVDNCWYGRVSIKDIDVLLTKKAAK
jgi:NADH:ubiquinone oxidoreductase subunit E